MAKFTTKQALYNEEGFNPCPVCGAETVQLMLPSHGFLVTHPACSNCRNFFVAKKSDSSEEIEVVAEEQYWARREVERSEACRRVSARLSDFMQRQKDART